MADAVPVFRFLDGRGEEESLKGGASSGSEGNAASWKSPSVGSKAMRSPTIRSGNTKSAAAAGKTNAAIDPLSHHILKRTNTENTIPQRMRTANVADSTKSDVVTPASETGAGGGSARSGAAEGSREEGAPHKEKKKVSFLSRFSIGKKKGMDADADDDDDESEQGDLRTEGMNAQAYAGAARSASGFMPQHKEPPRYIKVRARYKREREFNRMFLAQELCGTKTPVAVGEEKEKAVPDVPPGSRPTSREQHGGAVWTTEFSLDGKYLAAAGQDTVVRVWSVIATAGERAAHEAEEEQSEGTRAPLSAPVFRSKPVREFEGHGATVLDLSWSKNNFLLSSSMDKTVRLWHVSRAECLCTFKHRDFVTSIAFHPRDDRFFLAGSLDSVLRLWSIPDKAVAFWNQLPDLITAVSFTPDGRTAMAGVLSGLCLFYETEGLKYHTQIHVRSSRGRNAKGSKITGIRTATTPDGDVQILVSSNDSRVRLYALRDKSLAAKFRGHVNAVSQIRASFSDDGRYVICASEDRRTYIWSTGAGEEGARTPVEFFASHAGAVTTSVLAPAGTRALLAMSGDPVYDICDPPPVTLRSRAEGTRRPTGPGARHSGHAEGNIVITADLGGGIKVFRQDCAGGKRRAEVWETGSMLSSRRRGRGHIGRKSTESGTGLRVRTGTGLTEEREQSEEIMQWASEIQTPASSEADGLGSIRSMRTATTGTGTTVGADTPSVRSERSVSPGVVRRERAGPGASLAPGRKTEPAPGGLLPTPSFSLKLSRGGGNGGGGGGGGGWWKSDRGSEGSKG
ncbi:hypothetical protein VE02_05757 [Pseudogymnoascus sp. 03VT05]|nr:hypothetical protein VE02_05757 [Pseudogymnoascus sp. 03VT05]